MNARTREYLMDVGERTVATFAAAFVAVAGAPLVAGADPGTAWGAVSDLSVAQRAVIAGVVAVLTLVKGVVGGWAGDRVSAAWLPKGGPGGFLVDVGERAAATFVAAFLAVWGTPLVAGADPGTVWGAVSDLSMVQLGAVAGAVAVLTLFKGIVGSWVGDRGTAALLPARSASREYAPGAVRK